MGEEEICKNYLDFVKGFGQYTIDPDALEKYIDNIKDHAQSLYDQGILDKMSIFDNKKKEKEMTDYMPGKSEVLYMVRIHENFKFEAVLALQYLQKKVEGADTLKYFQVPQSLWNERFEEDNSEPFYLCYTPTEPIFISKIDAINEELHVLGPRDPYLLVEVAPFPKLFFKPWPAPSNVESFHKKFMLHPTSPKLISTAANSFDNTPREFDCWAPRKWNSFANTYDPIKTIVAECPGSCGYTLSWETKYLGDFGSQDGYFDDFLELSKCKRAAFNTSSNIKFSEYSDEFLTNYIQEIRKVLTGQFLRDFNCYMQNLDKIGRDGCTRDILLKDYNFETCDARYYKIYNISYENEIGNQKVKHLKKELNMMNNNHGGMFSNLMDKYKEMLVPVTDPNLRITMDGNVAVRNPKNNSEYVCIDQNNQPVAFPESFTMQVPIYVFKKPFSAVAVGDIIRKDLSYAKVIGKKEDGSLRVMNFTGSTSLKKGVKDFMLGDSYIDVVVNIMNFQATGINPMMLMLMNENGTGNLNFKDMMMFMMMSGQGGNMQSMIPMLMLMGDDKGGDSNKMLEMMMFMQMMNGGMQMPQMQMPNMNMFGQSMPNPFQNFANMFGGKAVQPPVGKTPTGFDPENSVEDCDPVENCDADEDETSE